MKNKTKTPNIENYLKGLEYPVDKDTIVEHASMHGAPHEVLDLLEGLSEDKYTLAADVLDEVRDMQY